MLLRLAAGGVRGCGSGGGARGDARFPARPRECLRLSDSPHRLPSSCSDFESAYALERHQCTKAYKKALKAMQGTAPHTQGDAEAAAGMGRPDNGRN